ncbi:MAG: PKD domain-containing protein, partial [Saprospiraceae bacterium]|nr:PKD domain-containing protein [Saprospiraceae bacterium]
MTKLVSSKKAILALVAVVALWSPLWAKHIIGGTINYVCKGGGDYTFTMKIYRDCSADGAPFDGDVNAPFPATLTVYKGNSTNPFKVLTISNPTITQLLPNISNPCLVVPPGVCVEEGVYVFNLDLPASTSSYHIVYQRCCRNNSITNIVDPGETGATYHIELTPEAQQLCSSSPVFKDFPPIAICTNEPIDFDHSAIDPEGDSLVYELCRPLDGGGGDMVNFDLPNGVAPDPDMPPPYDPVVFSGAYSFQNPLLASPALSLDPHTGFMTGVPIAQGQYVVGVCVKEYRNGVLLSTTLRDFQFNVVTCDPTVVADVLENDTVVLAEQQFYVVNACGANAVLFTNESYQQSFIKEFFWEFDINGTKQRFTDWSPTVTFPGLGTYYGLLALNPNAQACADTALIQVNVYPGIDADFEFDYDTCVAGPATFTDLTLAGAGPGSIVSWDWDFGDGKQSQVQDPVHNYLIPGNFNVQLLVRDTNNCTGLATKPLPYFPVPQLLVVAPSEYIGCQPATITFDNLSTPVNDSYTLDWDFGDGGSSGDISPTHVYEDVGTYTVSLSITSPLGCESDTTWNDLITV